MNMIIMIAIIFIGTLIMKRNFSRIVLFAFLLCLSGCSEVDIQQEKASVAMNVDSETTVSEETVAVETVEPEETIPAETKAAEEFEVVETSVPEETAIAHEHTYDEGTVTVAPTCTEEGVMTFTCTQCGDTYTKALPQKEHQWGEPVEAEQELLLNTNTKRIHYNFTGSHEHDWCISTMYDDNKKVVKATLSSLKAEGYKVCSNCARYDLVQQCMIYTCTECGETKTERR